MRLLLDFNMYLFLAQNGRDIPVFGRCPFTLYKRLLVRYNCYHSFEDHNSSSVAPQLDLWAVSTAAVLQQYNIGKYLVGPCTVYVRAVTPNLWSSCTVSLYFPAVNTCTKHSVMHYSSPRPSPSLIISIGCRIDRRYPRDDLPGTY